jgi:hypothetical protein
MAKKEKKELTEAEKAAKKAAAAERAKKYEAPREMFTEVNTTKLDKVTFVTRAVVIRGMGTYIETISSTGSVSGTFIKGTKTKKKKVWVSLVEDKGGKSKSFDEDDEDDSED